MPQTQINALIDIILYVIGLVFTDLVFINIVLDSTELVINAPVGQTTQVVAIEWIEINPLTRDVEQLINRRIGALFLFNGLIKIGVGQCFAQ